MSGYVLSRLEYDLCWDQLGLGEQPTALAIPSHGKDRAQRQELWHGAWGTLAGKGLVDEREIDSDLMGALSMLVAPEREIDARLRLNTQGPRVRALGVSKGQFSLVAMLTSEELHLYPIGADSLVGAMVGLLPWQETPSSRSVSIEAEVLDRAAEVAGESAERLAVGLRDGGLSWQDAQKVASVLGTVVGMGQFGTAWRCSRRSGLAPRQRGRYVVSFYDTPEGRWQFTRKRGWATLAPADHGRLTQALGELVAESVD